MTRATLQKLLILVVLLTILAWIVGRKRLHQANEPQALPEISVSATDTPPPGSSGFTYTSSRPLPRAGKPPPEEVLAAARQHLKEGGTEDKCGPYSLLGDVTEMDLLANCRRIAAQLDDTYRQRFGVTPVGQPAATILLFDNRDGYRGFAAAEGMTTAGYAGYSLPSRGYTAAWADASRSTDFAKTLAHELTHLVNRRALGGNLPRWLSEGLADAIGDTATTAGIQSLESLGGVEGEATRLRLGLESGQAHSVARLVSLDGTDFDAEAVSYDYEQSALLVRYLLLEPHLADGFRSFLAKLAEGEDYSPDLLQQHLEVQWTELDEGMATWLRSGAN